MKTIPTFKLALAISALSAIFSVTAAAQPSLGTSALLEGPGAGIDSVVLAVAAPTYTWTATANAAWLHLSVANQSGAGSTNVVFSCDANPGATRTGTLTIAGQTLTVTQAGSTYVAAPGPLTTLASGLAQPWGVAVDGAGNVYIADSYQSTGIQEWIMASNSVTTLVPSGLLWLAAGVAVDGAGNVYIADDSGGGAIEVWTAANNTLTTLVASGLNEPMGVAVDGAGNVYIADSFNNAIKEWTATNNTVTTLVSAGLNVPMGVAVDGAGNVYFSDENNNAIKEWTVANHAVTTLLASGLNRPSGVAVDGAGNVYIADTDNNAIKEWTAANNTVTTLVASGLSLSISVAVDAAHNVYIADWGNSAIKELPHAFVDPTGKAEGPFAGSDVLPVVLPATANLLASFSPTSDQPWLTITGITNGVVNFAFGATISNRTAHITLLGQPISITQIAGVTQPAQLTVCAGSPAIFAIGGTATNLTYQWQVSGDGGITFTNTSASDTNASYTNLVTTLAESGYQYQVIASTTGLSVTSAPPSVLTVNAPATASAGANQTICPGNSTAALGGVIGGGALGGIWSSSGTGTFSNPNDVTNATYSPSPADITAGTVTLTLTATGQLAPCAAIAQMSLAIPSLIAIGTNGQPTNLTVCAGSPAVFSVGATGGGLSYQWQVSQDGGITFTNTSATDTNASYTNLVTTLAESGYEYQVVIGNACSASVTSTQAVLTVYQPSTASVGANQTICAGQSTAPLGGAVGGAATGGVWSSSGTGTFSNPNDVTNATYTPSAADITTGTITLTLTAQPCGDTNTQVVVTINPTPPAPTTTGAAICGAGVASMSASGNGGTLNWYSDAGLTMLVNTGTSYSPTVSNTTTYYVTETSLTTPACTGPASPVTAFVSTGPSTANAGPNQVLPTLASTVQLAGSVSNAPGGTWSGGSGTYNPNASTLNAVYTPSATEVAAGSWALTLTAAPNGCGGAQATSTMKFTFMPRVVLPLNTNTSKLILTLCVDPHSGTTDLGSSCVTQTNAVQGSLSVALGTNGVPTSVALEDYSFTARAPYVMSYNWGIGSRSIPLITTIGTAANPVTITDYAPGSATPVPVVPDGSGYGGTFTLNNVPFASAGVGTYSGSVNAWLDLGSGAIDLSGPAAIPTVTGTVHVTNGVATVHLDFSVLETFYEPGSTWLTGYATYHAVVDGVGPTTTPAYMVWNGGNGNWDTNSFQWNAGSGQWDNILPDNAIFGNGQATVTITQLINARSLWFQSGSACTIGASGGGSLALQGACAITNDADSTISAPIVGTNGLNKYGAGTLNLDGANSYTGPTIVYGGVIDYGGGALSGTSPLLVTNGVTVDIGVPNGLQTVSCPIILSGAGTLPSHASGGQVTFTGPITLQNSSVIAGYADANATNIFNGVIGGSGDVTFDAEGNDSPSEVLFVLGATNTWNGNTWLTNNGAVALLQLSGTGGQLPATTVLKMSAGNSSSADSSVFDLNGNNQTLAGLADGPQLFAPTSVTNSSGAASVLTLNDADSHLFSGTLDGNLGLTKTGVGTATLAGANTYGGNTVISAGMLALSGSGTLGSASAQLTIGAGGTLDVSALGAYWSLGTAALNANGAAQAANLNGNSGGTVDLGIGPITVASYDGVHPALTIPQGSLSLNGNPFTINTIWPLGVGVYPVIQVASSNTVSAGILPAVSGTAIAHGYGGSISVGADGQVYVNVILVLLPSTITLGPVAPQTYGSVSLSATVNPPVATGAVTFYDGTNVLGSQTLDEVTGVVAFTPVANQLTVAASPHAIRAVYSGDPNYTGSSSSVSNLTITVRPVLVTGTRTYDGTALMPVASLTFGNNVDPGNVSLSGTAVLAGKNTPSEAVVPSTFAAPSRVQAATGNTGTGTPTSFTVTVATPANGNTLVAVIATRGSALGTVSAVTQTGATWSRVSQAANTSTTTEIWYAPNVQSAGTTVTITESGVRAAAVVMEYSGVFTTTPVDQTANNTGNSTTPTTGTTPTTTQRNELWVGAIGITNSGPTLTISGAPTFGLVASAQSGNSTAANNAKVFALDYTNNTAGATASSGGTLSTGGLWSGAMATFFGTPALTLSGSGAGNYTVASFDPGSIVTINKLPVTASTVAYSKTYDGTTSAGGTPTFTPSLLWGDTASQAFTSRNVGASVSLVASISDGNGGNNYLITQGGASGTIGQKPLTSTNLTVVSPMSYAGPSTAPTINGSPGQFLAAETAGTGATNDGKPYSVDSVSPNGTAVGTFATPYIGVSKAVTVGGVGVTGTGSGNYSVIQQGGLTATVTQAVVTVSGSKLYDGTTNVAAGNLSVANANDDTLTLSGSATLAGRNVGAEAILGSASYATPTRVQAATGNTGTGSSSTSFTVNLGSAPVNGNTLVAVIATRGTTSGRVTGITQSAGTAAWSHVVDVANAGGVTTEIWYAPNVFFAGTGVTIAQAASRSAAIVMEYSGVLTVGALDQIGSTTGSTGASTGSTTSPTTQAAELWVGGIGFTNSNFYLTNTSSPLFTTVTNAQSGNSTAANNAKVYALEYKASATGTASSSGTVNTNGNYAGVIATFKAQPGTGLTVGPANSVATNYTMVGASGLVTVAATNLTVTATANTKLYDGTTSATNPPIITVGSIQSGDTAPAWTESYDTKNAGTGKTLTPAHLPVNDNNGGLNYNVTYATVNSGEIDPLGTTTLLAVDINPSGRTTNVTFTATVAGVLPAADLPTSNVVFLANGTPFATNGPLVSGSITASTVSLPAGTNVITAQYVGDGNFLGSTSSSLSEVVTNNVIYSQTNVVGSIVNNQNGTFTLYMVGTPGADYYVVASSSITEQTAAWTPVPGSTNTAASPSGAWSCMVSNPAPAYYRPVAVNPAP